VNGSEYNGNKDRIMMAKNLMMIVCCVLLAGCPSVKPVDDIMNMSEEGQSIGTTYSVPDCCSTKK
jgi:uncharacterized lipoprotein YajG